MRKRETQPLGELSVDGPGGNGDSYVLRLFVNGTTPTALRAIRNMESICEQHLQGRYKLEVIDISQQPSRLQEEQIIASPTLIKQLPSPLRRLVGDMSNTEKVLLGLQVQPVPHSSRRP